METGTDTVPNTPPTAASAGSDLNGLNITHHIISIVNKVVITVFFRHGGS